MNDIARFFQLLYHHRKLFWWTFAVFVAIGLAVSLSVKPVYESRSIVKIGSNIQMGQVSLARDLETLNERFRIFIGLSRNVERARNLAARLMYLHGGETPFFGAPERPYLADARSLDTWDEMVQLKVRAGNRQDAIQLADELLEEILRVQNEAVAENREAVTRILELTEKESVGLESMPDSADKSLAQVLLAERVARLRQQLHEFIHDSEIVQAPQGVVEKIKPRLFLYLVTSVFVSLLSSVVLVVVVVWLRALRRQLRTGSTTH